LWLGVVVQMAHNVFLYLLLLIGSVGCVGSPPYLEYTLSRTAIKYAKSSKASGLAPGTWHKAEKYFLQAKKYYNNQDYEDARLSFVRSRIMAEKAENISRLKSFESGEGLP